MTARSDKRHPGISIAKVALLLAFTALAVAAAVLVLTSKPVEITFEEKRPVHLERLPKPENDSMYVVVDAKRGEFPVEAIRLLVDSTTVSPPGSSPAGAVLPILGDTDETAFVIAERENEFYTYGSFAIARSERDAITSGAIPRKWLDSLLGAEVVSTDVGRAYQINALNISSPLYVEIDEDGESAYISDSLFDLERIREVRAGRMPGMESDWHEGDDWGGHMLVSDGGLAKMLLTDAEELSHSDAVTFKISWATSGSGTYTLSDTTPAGHAVWSASGVENLVGKQFAVSLKPLDWSTQDLFIPEPLIMSIGLNLPDPGKNVQELPAPFAATAKHLERMRLKPTEIRNILTGPFSLSLGGRTQVLWFDLPGVVLDMPGRGAAANTLVDRFWNETFLGASPKPLDGYTNGGTTDLPFTVMAASNAETTIIGLTTPDVEHSAEMRDLLSDEKSAIGWFFIDIPKLGSALSDMPTFGALLNDDEGLPLEEDMASLLRESMSKLGRLFVSFESVTGGRALWYH